MGGTILQALAQIVSPSDYFPVQHYDGANGHLTQGVGFFGLHQGFAHISGVIHKAFPFSKSVLTRLIFKHNYIHSPSALLA
ncbi:MAG: hypothetical protein PHP51_08850 [Desulfotomaculaceae bacterium]|nr:hypothetical protein [Desulfotomaculaceae bacterium]